MPVTLLDIAQSLGVSKAAVSSVLNGKAKQMRISDALAERIRQRAAEMHYRPSAAARSIITGRTYQLGVLIPNTDQRPFMSPNIYDFILGINHYLQPMGYVTSLIRVQEVLESDDATAQSRIFIEKVLDGVILIGATPMQKAFEIVSRYWPSNLLLDTTEWSDFNCLRRNEKEAGAMATKKAVEAGYRRLVWSDRLPEPTSHYSLGERYQGVMETAQQLDASVEYLPGALSTLTAPADRWHQQALQAHLAQGRFALVAGNALDAIRCATLASELGARVGKDFGVVCCDDGSHMPNLWPTLCRVGFDRFQIGRQAANMWLDIFNATDHRQPSVVCDSCWIDGNTL